MNNAHKYRDRFSDQCISPIIKDVKNVNQLKDDLKYQAALTRVIVKNQSPLRILMNEKTIDRLLLVCMCDIDVNGGLWMVAGGGGGEAAEMKEEKKEGLICQSQGDADNIDLMTSSFFVHHFTIYK